MTRTTAPALILLFLRAVQAASARRICRYMASTPLPYTPHATHTTLWRLAREGRIAHVGYGWYQRGGQ